MTRLGLQPGRPGARGGDAAAGGRGRHDARLAVHRTTRVGPFQRRDRVRGGTAVRARRLRRVPLVPHRDDRLPRGDLGDPHPEALDRCRRGARAGAQRRARPGGRPLAGDDRRGRRPAHRPGRNALLKAIEEPTARTVWLLCAPTVEDVLPTIRSRTRLVVLATPAPEEIAAPPRSRATASRPSARRTPPAPARATSAGPGRWRPTRPRSPGVATWSRCRPSSRPWAGA